MSPGAAAGFQVGWQSCACPMICYLKIIFMHCYAVQRVREQLGWLEAEETDGWDVFWSDQSISLARAVAMHPMQVRSFSLLTQTAVSYSYLDKHKVQYVAIASNGAWSLAWQLSLSSVSITPCVSALPVLCSQKINHFAGMLELCRKKTLARSISAMAAQFLGHFQFCPKTYVLPEDLPALWKDFKCPKKGKPKTLILKPDSGSQVAPSANPSCGIQNLFWGHKQFSRHDNPAPNLQSNPLKMLHIPVSLCACPARLICHYVVEQRALKCKGSCACEI